MKQIFQNLTDGKIILEDLPIPTSGENYVLIKSLKSVISFGTEKMLVDFGKANYINKALQQPDRVRQVIEKVKTDGIYSTVESIKNKLNQPIQLGYCNLGVVVKSSSDEFREGDKVVSNGAHAEYVCVPENLCCKVPSNINDDTSAFTVIASIGLQAVRITNPKLGDKVVVFGLGLIGLLTVQILIANGCEVLGIDKNEIRCNIAKSYGAKIINSSEDIDVISTVNNFSSGVGVDSVIIAASSKSNDIIHNSAQFCRQRGSVTLVGDIGLNIKRDDFYKKEIKFQVSSSYGPGRYDRDYEEKGFDYPIGLVRWTCKRNFNAILNLMQNGSIDTELLISDKFSIDDYQKAYSKFEDGKSLGILIEYIQNDTHEINFKNLKNNSIIFHDKFESNLKNRNSSTILGCIGAGEYASKILFPEFKKNNVFFDTIVSAGSLRSKLQAKKYKANKITTNVDEVYNNKDINTVLITTRHNEHASQIIGSLQNNKNIFVEKPLCLNETELNLIEETYNKAIKRNPDLILMVGYNRRYSPITKKMKNLLKYKNAPKVVIYTVNAGQIDKSHWTQDRNIGGGRIIGEVCHFIDFVKYIVGKPVLGQHKVTVLENSNGDNVSDSITINFSFTDGSTATIHYLSNGNKSYPKERVEVFCQNTILKLNNFKSLKGYGFRSFSRLRKWKQDKGQKNCVSEFVDCVKNSKQPPISFEEILDTSRITFNVAKELWKN